jgi:hypothetical protein
MLNDSWAGRNPTKVVVPIEEEEEVDKLNQYFDTICVRIIC